MSGGSATNRISGWLNKTTEVAGRSAAWLAVVLVATTGLVVLLRYAFSTGSISLQESLIYINALFFVVGSAYTLKHDGHVRVDIFYNKLGARGQAVINLFGVLVFLLPVTLFILYSSWDYVALSWRIRERSAESSGLAIVYLLKSTILLLGFVLVWQGLAEAIKTIFVLLRTDRNG